MKSNIHLYSDAFSIHRTEKVLAAQAEAEKIKVC